jgi:SAM-dependent methyltransferase
LIEFTGERVVPGQVDVDLWNEHLARYAFAARLAAGKRVLDAGCGSGYGTAELAAAARTAIGFDAAHDAVTYANRSYERPNLHFLQASCTSLPLAPGTLDLIVAFEVIEHIAEWPSFLSEVRRVLAPQGRFIVSTPNKNYYSDTRRETGPNPYHVHEFEFDEFAAELSKHFLQITLYLENHVEGIAFQPAGSAFDGEPELRRLPTSPDPATAHFFIAICSETPQAPPPGFIYVPSTANVLRERERHIEKLEIDVARLRREKQELVELFRAQKAELEQSNAWAHDLEERLTAAQARIVQVQNELSETTAGYEAKVAELEQENLTKTRWAQGLDAEVEELRRQLNLVRGSRWFKVGNRLGVGPVLDRK